MTTRRAAVGILVLAIVAGSWWAVDRLADGGSCDGGRGIRIATNCVDLDERSLDTRSDGIGDLGLLADFDELRLLDIELSDLDGDLTGLEALTGLRVLTIRGDGEEVDLGALGALTELETLELFRLDIGDLSEVTLPGLLDLQLDTVTIDGFPSMPQAAGVTMWSPQTPALPDASAAPQLTRLDLRRTGPVDTGTLAGLVTLERLTIDAALDTRLDIEDLGFVAGMSGLEDLSIAGESSVRDLAPLVDLPLAYLTLEHLPVGDLSPLGQIPTLEQLRVRDAPVVDLRPLAPLTNLRRLSLSETEVRSLQGVEAMTRLEWLTISRSQVRDLEPLAELRQLTELGLDESQVRDLTPLAGLTELTRLSLWGNPVTDLTGIEDLPLVSINLNSSAVTSIEPLAGMMTLESLRIGFTPVTDLSPLADLPLLEDLVPPTGDAADDRDEVLAILAGRDPGDG